MAISSEHIAYLEDLFSVVDGASIRKMFGGVENIPKWPDVRAFTS